MQNEESFSVDVSDDEEVKTSDEEVEPSEHGEQVIFSLWNTCQFAGNIHMKQKAHFFHLHEYWMTWISPKLYWILYLLYEGGYFINQL